MTNLCVFEEIETALEPVEEFWKSPWGDHLQPHKVLLNKTFHYRITKGTVVAYEKFEEIQYVNLLVTVQV